MPCSGYGDRPRNKKNTRKGKRRGRLGGGPSNTISDARTYATSKKTVPWLPMVVTQPTTPSDCTLHFILIRPDFSSFRAHSRTSTISLTFNFLVVSLSFRETSFAPLPSRVNDSVRM